MGNFGQGACYDEFNHTWVRGSLLFMTYSDLYANRIKELCLQHSITLNRLATLSGLKQSTIDNIIHGKSRNPKVRTLHKIATTFDLTLSEFLDFPELNEYLIDEEEE